MASLNKKKSGKLISICALAIAVVIPVAGLMYGQASAREEKQTLLAQRNKIEKLWTAKERAESEANEQRQVEQELSERYRAVLTAINQTLPGIVCWGDSITAGAGGMGTTYPATLQYLLRHDINTSFECFYPAKFQTNLSFSLTIPVVNMGVPGESSITVAGRNGAIPYVVTQAFTIPEDATTQVRIRIASQNGEAVEPLVLGNRGLNRVTVGGVEGELKLRQSSGKTDRYEYYFIRSESGEAVKVEVGTPIKTTAEEAYKDYLAVIQLGHNGGWTDAADLISQIDAIIAAQNYPDRYIVLGLAFGDATELEQVNGALAEAYGSHFIELWHYMREDALVDAGIEATQEDLEALEEGLIPISLTDGGNTFNGTGYDIVANCIQRKINELGYLDTINALLGIE